MWTNWKLIVGSALLALTLQAATADAVAFKMANYTNYTFRMRVHDRGEWRPWVVCPPGFWGVVAPSVKRYEHQVQIEVREGRSWRPIYSNHHGSRAFTRVVQAVSAGNGAVFAWWDEPPGCRDWPPRPGFNEGTCLQPSGWLLGQLPGLIRKAATTAAFAALGG